jgi:8-oxo-dGTP diphosphatase
MAELVLRVAAKGVIVNEKGEVLIVREAKTYEEGTRTGRYGLPGGRLNVGESYIDGLRREVREETNLDIEPGRPVYVGEWRPIIKGVPYQIIAVFTICKLKTYDVRLSNEHDKFAWVKPRERVGYDIMDPDWDVIDAYAVLA